MAARNRGPRTNLVKEDLADEVQLWHSIVDKIRRCGAIHKQYDDVFASVQAAEEEKSLVEDDPAASLTHVDNICQLHREGLKLAEEEQKLLVEEPDALLSNLETLISVRSAFESEVPAPSVSSSRSGIERGSVVVNVPGGGGGAGAGLRGGEGGGGGGGPGKASARNLKRRLDAEGPGTGGVVSAVESPAMTPEPVSATAVAGRLVGKGGSRSGSVGLGSASKSEAGSEGLDGPKSAIHDKYNALKIGTQVFLRNKDKKSDGEGILCSITSVIGDGKNRRYEVQDPEPDETGHQPLPYKALLSSLEAIPPPPATHTLPDLPKGKQVIAVYPDTSTFYKAEVVGRRGEWVRLRFEGEEERDKEQEVERRLVLDAK